MHHGKTMSNRTFRLHERFRIIFNEKHSSLRCFFYRNRFVSIQTGNMRIFATEILKDSKGIVPNLFPKMLISMQGRREGTSSVVFELLIKNCETDSINLSIFNYLVLNINLFIFNCLMSNFCFPKNIYFAGKRERLFMGARPQFQILNSPGEMMTCYLQDSNRFLGYCTLRTSIPNCGFLAKGI